MRAAPSPVVQDFLGRLEGVKADGSGWSARCPCRNDDNNPSLHVGEGRDGRVLVTCHRGGGCELPDICAAVNLTVNDLFADTAKSDEKPKLTHTYDYRDVDGTLLFQKLRLMYADGKKTFRQRKPNPDGSWNYSLGEVPKVLYRLPQVAAAVAAGDGVFVVEGEKDADTLTELGYTATTMPGGAGKWLDLHTQVLAGATVWIIQDNDEPGRNHAVQVQEALMAAGATVTMYAPPSQHKDISDFVAAGGNVDGLQVVEPDVPGVLDELMVAIAAVQAKGFDDTKAIIRVRGLLDRLDPNVTQIGDPGRLVNWADFVDEPVDDSYNWVIPGVLERQDRVIVVAAEGVGKTMLSRQMAITTAYGVHPFTFEPMAAVRTLTIDLENPERIIRRMSTKIIHNAARLSRDSPAGAHLLIRPAGMDLLNPADRIVLEEAIERTEPGLVCLGPLYKSFVDSGTRTSEALAVDIAKYLDYLRTTYNFALWIEHHAPLGGSGGRELRPFGSAVWSRWPEFGWTLEPDLTAEQPHVYKWGRFRNDREPRHRPVKVKRGRAFPFEVVEFFKVD